MTTQGAKPMDIETEQPQAQQAAGMRTRSGKEEAEAKRPEVAEQKEGGLAGKEKAQVTTRREEDLKPTVGLLMPRQRTAYDAQAEAGSKHAKPTENLGVVWDGPNKVTVKNVGYPQMRTPSGAKINHGVILRVIATNICGSDLHMYRGTMPGMQKGMTFGHEVTGEVFEIGDAVERFDVGDIVSVPFNVSCGCCDNCRERKVNLCLRANDLGVGGAYGFANGGGWQGGQAQFHLVPWADHVLIKIPPTIAMDSKKILSFACLSDVYPTGYHAALQAGVCAGSIVYIAGAGPIGLCAARSCQLLGAVEVIVGDANAERLQQAASFGCKTIDLTKLASGERGPEALKLAIAELLPQWKNGPHHLVDAAIDCVGYEACGLGSQSHKRIDEQALDTVFHVTKSGGKVGVPGIYPMADEGGPTEENKAGVYALKYGVPWNKGIQFAGGQCPTLNYILPLMKTIAHDVVDLTKVLKFKVIKLEDAPAAYASFEKGEAVKYIIDPNGMLAQAGCTASGSGAQEGQRQEKTEK